MGAPAALLVREATSEDAEAIVEFNRRMAAETEGVSLPLDTLRRGVAAALSDRAKARYFLACDGTRPVGQVMVTLEWSDWRNGFFWWLQSVYVLPEYRGKGVFRRLYEHVCELARQSGDVVGIRLYVEQHNKVAQAVYQRLGMRYANYLVYESPRLARAGRSAG